MTLYIVYKFGNIRSGRPNTGDYEYEIINARRAALVAILSSNNFFETIATISGSTGRIFTNFLAIGRYLNVDYRSGRLFLIAQGTLPWQPILV